MTCLVNKIGESVTMIEVDELTKEWVVRADDDSEAWHLREAPDEASPNEHTDLRSNFHGGGHA